MSNHNPKTEITWQQRADAIDRLFASTVGFSDFERTFLKSVRDQIKLSVKQIDCLNGIFHRHSGAPLIRAEGVEYPKNWLSPGYKNIRNRHKSIEDADSD